MTALPRELWLTILEDVSLPLSMCIAHRERLGSARASLLQCCLVCRDWSTPAQRLLYRFVDFEDFTALDAFQDIISSNSEKASWLSHSVQGLAFPLSWPSKDYARVVEGILLLTHNIRHLEVPTALCDFSSDTLKLLRECGTDPISLYLRTGTTRAHGKILTSVFTAFRNVQILEVENLIGPPLQPLSIEQQLPLRSFSIRTRYKQSYAPFICSIVKASSSREYDGIQALLIENTTDEDFKQILQSQGPSLRVLGLYGTSSTLGDADFESCKNLEVMTLPTVPRTALFPKTLRHVIITNIASDIPIKEEVIVKFTNDLSELPHLKSLTWHHYRQPPPSESLALFCARHSIELRLRDTLPGVDYVQSALIREALDM